MQLPPSLAFGTTWVLAILFGFVVSPLIFADDARDSQLGTLVDAFVSGDGADGSAASGELLAAMGSADALTRQFLAQRTRRQAEEVADVLDASPPPPPVRRRQLEAQLERLQAVQLALNGHADVLRRIQAESVRTAPAPPEDVPTAAEERADLDIQIAHFDDRLAALERDWASASNDFGAEADRFRGLVDRVRNAYGELDQTAAAYPELQVRLRELCESAKEAVSLAQDNAFAARQALARLDAGLADAGLQVGQCASADDAAAIEATLDTAEDAYKDAQIRTDAADDARAQAGALAARVAEARAAMQTDVARRPDVDNQITRDSRQAGEVFRTAMAAFQALERLDRKRNSLAQQIAEAYAYYRAMFPRSAQLLQRLQERAVGLLPDFENAVSRRTALRRGLDTLVELHQGLQHLDDRRGLPECRLGSAADTESAAARAAVDAATGRLAESARLRRIAADCRSSSSALSSRATAPVVAIPGGQVSPPSAPPSPQPPTISWPPPAQTSGAIVIVGPLRLAPGASWRFEATDGSGYRYEGTRWSTNDDSVIGIDPGTGEAIARREGTATLMAHHPKADRTGYLEVQVALEHVLPDFRGMTSAQADAAARELRIRLRLGAALGPAPQPALSGTVGAQDWPPGTPEGQGGFPVVEVRLYDDVASAGGPFTSSVADSELSFDEWMRSPEGRQAQAEADARPGSGELQGDLDEDARRTLIQGQTKYAVTFECGPARVRLAPDGGAELLGDIECLITLTDGRPSGDMSWSRATYRVRLSPLGPGTTGRLDVTRQVDYTLDYTSRSGPGQRRTEYKPERTWGKLVRTDTSWTLHLPNGMSGRVADLPWRMQ